MFYAFNTFVLKDTHNMGWEVMLNMHISTMLQPLHFTKPSPSTFIVYKCSALPLDTALRSKKDDMIVLELVQISLMKCDLHTSCFTFFVYLLFIDIFYNITASCIGNFSLLHPLLLALLLHNLYQLFNHNHRFALKSYTKYNKCAINVCICCPPVSILKCCWCNVHVHIGCESSVRFKLSVLHGQSPKLFNIYANVFPAKNQFAQGYIYTDNTFVGFYITVQHDSAVSFVSCIQEICTYVVSNF